MVGFETTTGNYQKLRELPPSERRSRIAKWAIGGAAGVGVVAGVALAAAFGSIAASLANAPVGDAIAVVDPDLLAHLGGADCCGGCDAGCHDCGDGCALC
jgi:hypothetical protein